MSFEITVESGKSRLLKTAGKVCDRDIVVTATGGSDDLVKQLIDKSITSFDGSEIETIGTYAFAGCNKLTDLDFPNCTSVEMYAFSSATALVSVNLPKVQLINSNTFQLCSSLKTINIPEATTLYSNAIRDATALEKIDLPKVGRILSQVFLNCTMLTTVILRSNTPCTLGSTNSFNGTPFANGTGYIYVPASLIDSYKTATNWSTFANQFRAIEDYPEITGG